MHQDFGKKTSKNRWSGEWEIDEWREEEALRLGLARISAEDGNLEAYKSRNGNRGFVQLNCSVKCDRCWMEDNCNLIATGKGGKSGRIAFDLSFNKDLRETTFLRLSSCMDSRQSIKISLSTSLQFLTISIIAAIGISSRKFCYSESSFWAKLF